MGSRRDPTPEEVERGKTCPTCKRVPVSGKTWSLLTSQDEQLRVLRNRIATLEKRAQLAERLVERGRLTEPTKEESDDD